MKARFSYLPLFPVLAAGMMLLPVTAQAQDAPRETAPGQSPQAAPNPEQIQAMVRELQELHRAGKREEARPLIQRLRAIAKENPQLADPIHNAMKPQGQPGGERPNMPTGSERPLAQPNPAPEQPQMRPQMPGGQEHPLAQPNPMGQGQPQAWPHMRGGQDRPMVQPNPMGPGQPQMWPNMQGGRGWQMARPHGFGGWGPRMGQSNMPGQQPQARQQMSGGQCGPMFQSHRRGGWGSRMQRDNMLGWHGGQMFRSHRHGGWGPRMEQSNMAWKQRQMQRKNMFGWQGGQMSRSHRHGGWGPRMIQPNAAGQARQQARPNMMQPQRPMVRPNMPDGQAKPPVQADQSQMARIRHLRQAAEHLAAAGFAEQAAKAREESGRMEAELNQRKAQAPAPADMTAPREAPRRGLNQDNNVKPEANRAPDPNAAMLNEMRKLGKQIQQLNSRMQKLETRGAE